MAYENSMANYYAHCDPCVKPAYDPCAKPAYDPCVKPPVNPCTLPLPPCPYLSLDNDMRMLWEQHVYWTRMAIMSIEHNLPDAASVNNQLMRNPNDIAKLFGKYYDAAASKKIANLLSEHLQIAAQFVTAMKDCQTDLANCRQKQWYENANELACYLCKLNACYDCRKLRDMLYQHLQLTTKEATMRLNGNYSADIQAFSQIETEAVKMADYFTQGLVRQFPSKFKGTAVNPLPAQMY